MPFAGDCEDFAIAKYITLVAMGIPDYNLKVTYVMRLNRPHMVLYYAPPGSVPLVLDNIDKEIKPANRRQDLMPIYSFNGNGLWINGKYSGPAVDLDMWRDLVARL